MATTAKTALTAFGKSSMKISHPNPITTNTNRRMRAVLSTAGPLRSPTCNPLPWGSLWCQPVRNKQFAIALQNIIHSFIHDAFHEWKEIMFSICSLLLCLVQLPHDFISSKNYLILKCILSFENNSCMVLFCPPYLQPTAT